jgi:hypothetical protein
MDRILRGPHNSWVSGPGSWVKLGVNHNIAPRGSQRMDSIKYARFLASGVFLNKFVNLQKLDVLCPGHFVSWTFCNWTFCNWTFCGCALYGSKRRED